MEVLNKSKHFLKVKKDTCVGLGNFDGLHIGHMALLNTIKRESEIHGYKTVVYTFKKHPEHILRHKLFSPLIMTLEQKIDLLNEINMDYLCLDEFDEEYSRITPKEFVKDILKERFNAKLVVVGFNYKFGYKGMGEIDYLKKASLKYGFRVIVIPPVKINNEIVSSSSIRHYIKKGNIEKAFQLLGRHFSLTGTVGIGKQIGGSLGFPTANITPEDFLIIPKTGVYITRTYLNNKWYDSITNVGVCPTIKDLKKSIVETHIFNFNKVLYGEKIIVFFLKKIRDEVHFSTKDELVKQIGKDKKQAEKYFRI